MGVRGPKPEPASVKRAKGNSARRPIADDAAPARASGASVEPPSWLKKDARDVWRRLAPRLVAKRLLSEDYSETFARYCVNFARWRKMQRRLDRLGEIYEIETASGKVRRADPAYLIGDRLERQLVSAEAVFGLNPAERQRLYAARAALPAGFGDDDLFGRGGQARSDEPAAPAKPSADSDGSPIGFLQ